MQNDLIFIIWCIQHRIEKKKKNTQNDEMESKKRDQI